MTTTALEPGVVMCLDDMLSGEECADILDELKYAWWWGSPLVQRGSDGALISRRSYRRTSSTTSEEWMGERTVQVLRRLEEDLHRVVGLRPDHLENWQAVRYRRGERFDEHHDAGFFASDPHGERTNSWSSTSTASRAADRSISPLAPAHPAMARTRAGVAQSPAGQHPGSRMRHVASPARRTKTTLTVWEREGRTRRTPPPRR